MPRQHRATISSGQASSSIVQISANPQQDAKPHSSLVSLQLVNPNSKVTLPPPGSSQITVLSDKNFAAKQGEGLITLRPPASQQSML